MPSADSAPSSAGPAATPSGGSLLASAVPSFARLHDAAPHARVLSNGRYRCVLTSGGGGFSALGAGRLTRWSGDRTADADGVLVYLRDLDSGEVWSLGAAPCGETGGTFFARTAPGSVTLGRRHEGIEATCEVFVSAEADVEVRRLVLRNRAARARRVDVCVVADLESASGVLLPRATVPARAAFDLEVTDEGTTLLARRLAATAGASSEGGDTWIATTLLAEDGTTASGHRVQTDRARFVGRGRGFVEPAALVGDAAEAWAPPASGPATEALLAHACTVEMAAGGESGLAWLMAAGPAREVVEGALASLREAPARADAAKRAAAGEKDSRRRSGLAGHAAELAQELAGALLYGNPALVDLASLETRARSAATSPSAGHRAPTDDAAPPSDALLVVAPLGHGDATRAQDLRRLAAYLHDLGLQLDVRLVCEEADCTAASCALRSVLDGAPSGFSLVCATEIGDDAVAALRLRARWVVEATLPSLEEEAAEPAPLRGRRYRFKDDAATPRRDKLLLLNGYGGVSADGRDYAIHVGPAGASREARPPRRWQDLLAGSALGCAVSESGAACTYTEGATHWQLTPWSGDDVVDPHHEALYLREHSNGRFWSPQPGPAPSGAWCEVRFSQARAQWSQRSEAIDQQVETFVASGEATRFVRIRLGNRGTRERQLSLYWSARLVLGHNEWRDAGTIVTARDDASGLLVASNPASAAAGALAFATVLSGSDAPASWTTDRRGFLGRGGSTQAPRAVVAGEPLDARAGAGLDPCFVFEVPVTLAARASVEVVLVFGAASSLEDAVARVERHREEGAVEAVLVEATAVARDLATVLEVHTPSKPIDLLLGGWSLQAARAGWRPPGAVADDLVSAAAFLWPRPELAREAIRRAATRLASHVGHGSDAGDADGTTASTPWLPWLACRYVEMTGDDNLLSERLASATLPAGDGEGEAGAAAMPAPTVYELCAQVLDAATAEAASFASEPRAADGFVLASVLADFLPLVEQRADWERLRRLRERREILVAALASRGAEPADASLHAWSVLSGIAPAERALDALRAFEGGAHRDSAVAAWTVAALARAGRRDLVANTLEKAASWSLARDADGATALGTEPYAQPHGVHASGGLAGRGEGTWNPVAASWMYRVAVEGLLGLRIEQGRLLRVAPCIPDEWPGLRVRYRLPDGKTILDIEIDNSAGCASRVVSATVDNHAVSVDRAGARIVLRRDGKLHRVKVTLG